MVINYKDRLRHTSALQITCPLQILGEKKKKKNETKRENIFSIFVSSWQVPPANVSFQRSTANKLLSRNTLNSMYKSLGSVEMLPGFLRLSTTNNMLSARDMQVTVRVWLLSLSFLLVYQQQTNTGTRMTWAGLFSLRWLCAFIWHASYPDAIIILFTIIFWNSSQVSAFENKRSMLKE